MGGFWGRVGLRWLEMVSAHCGPVFIGELSLQAGEDAAPERLLAAVARSDVLRLDVETTSDLKKFNQIK